MGYDQARKESACPRYRMWRNISPDRRLSAMSWADGLTVPLALAAGLSAAVSSTKIIVTAGLAEIVAGAIAMGLGRYLAARTDQEHYPSEERREYGEPPRARSSGSGDNLQGLWPRRRRVAAHCGRDHQQSSTVGRFHDAVRTWPRTSRSYAGSYQCSNDYRVLPGRRPDPAGTLHLHVTHGSRVQGVRAVDGPGSCCVRAVKGRLTGLSVVKSSVQTAAVGGLATAAAYYLVSLFG